MWWLVACRDPAYPGCEDPGIPLRADAPTWHGEVRARVEARCAGCHTDGGMAPMPFDDYGEAAPWADAMANAVEARTMPPWPPSDCCRALDHRAALDPDEAAAFVAWAEAGAPEGDPSAYVPPELAPSGLDRVDRTLRMPEAYTPAPAPGTTDDTRCFLLDWPEAERRYVTGFGVTPGVPSEVHHVMALTVTAVAVPSLRLLDDADGGPGWSCPGGVVLGATGWIGAWSPGWTAREMPDGTGQRIDPSDQVVLTVHYSVQAGPPAPDRTSLELRLDDAVDSELWSIPVTDPLWLTTLRIPADEPDYAVSYATHPLSTRTVVGVNLHLHERGRSGKVGIRHADGTTDCLLQIDDWAHEWQGDYLLTEPVRLRADDALFVECHWDNTVGNQRVVNGIPEAPRALRWAEDEEMCVAFVSTRR